MKCAIRILIAFLGVILLTGVGDPWPDGERRLDVTEGPLQGAQTLYDLMHYPGIASIPSGWDDWYFGDATDDGNGWPVCTDGGTCADKANCCLTTADVEDNCALDDYCIFENGIGWDDLDTFEDGMTIVPTGADTTDITVILTAERLLLHGGTRPLIECNGNQPAGDGEVFIVDPGGAAGGRVLVQSMRFGCDLKNDVISPEDLSKAYFIDVEGVAEVTGEDPGTNAAWEIAVTDAYEFFCLRCDGHTTNYSGLRIRGNDVLSLGTVIGGRFTVTGEAYQTAAAISTDPGAGGDFAGHFSIIGTRMAVLDDAAAGGNQPRYGFLRSRNTAATARFNLLGTVVESMDTTDGSSGAWGYYFKHDGGTADHDVRIYEAVAYDIHSDGQAAGFYWEGSADNAQLQYFVAKGLTAENILSDSSTERGMWFKTFDDGTTNIQIIGEADCWYSHQLGGSDQAWRCETCETGTGGWATRQALLAPTTGIGIFLPDMAFGRFFDARPTTFTFLVGGSGLDALHPSYSRGAGGACNDGLQMPLPAPIPKEWNLTGSLGGTQDIHHLNFNTPSEVWAVMATDPTR